MSPCRGGDGGRTKVRPRQAELKSLFCECARAAAEPDGKSDECPRVEPTTYVGDDEDLEIPPEEVFSRLSLSATQSYQTAYTQMGCGYDASGALNEDLWQDGKVFGECEADGRGKVAYGCRQPLIKKNLTYIQEDTPDGGPSTNQCAQSWLGLEIEVAICDSSKENCDPEVRSDDKRSDDTR